MCPSNKSKTKIIAMPKSWLLVNGFSLCLEVQWIKPRHLQRYWVGLLFLPQLAQVGGGRIDWWPFIENIIVSPLLRNTSSWEDSVSGVLSSSGPLRGSWGTLYPAAASAHTLIYGQGISSCPWLPWFSLNPNILIWMCCLLWYNTWILQKQP